MYRSQLAPFRSLASIAPSTRVTPPQTLLDLYTPFNELYKTVRPDRNSPTVLDPLEMKYLRSLVDSLEKRLITSGQSPILVAQTQQARDTKAAFENATFREWAMREFRKHDKVFQRHDKVFQRHDKVFQRHAKDIQHLNAAVAATLPLSTAIALKAGLTTLALANVLTTLPGHKPTPAKCLNLLHQLHFVQQPTTSTVSGFAALREASIRLSKPFPQTTLSQHRDQLYLQLEQYLIHAGRDGHLICNAFRLIEHGGLVRQNRNQHAHEMDVKTFLANVHAVMDVAAKNKQTLPAGWQELLQLWKSLIGQTALRSAAAARKGQIPPADLGIILHNVSSAT